MRTDQDKRQAALRKNNDYLNLEIVKQQQIMAYIEQSENKQNASKSFQSNLDDNILNEPQEVAKYINKYFSEIEQPM